MSLGEWQQRGWLIRHETSLQEIEELLGVVDRDLRDCTVTSLSTDWRLNIAYNAALQAASAALAASGYRAKRDAHHYRVIKSLGLTIGADEHMVRTLDRFRKKRNISDYERAGLVSETEVEELIGLARQLRQAVVEWLREKHPDLIGRAR
jgi:uncharacterized protein (UPF0332 family)